MGLILDVIIILILILAAAGICFVGLASGSVAQTTYRRLENRIM